MINNKIHLNVKKNNNPALFALFTLFLSHLYSPLFSTLHWPFAGINIVEQRLLVALKISAHLHEKCQRAVVKTQSRHTPTRIIPLRVTVSDRARAVEVCGEVKRPVWRDAVWFIHCIQTASDDSETTASPEPQWQVYHHLWDLKTHVAYTPHTFTHKAF